MYIKGNISLTNQIYNTVSELAGPGMMMAVGQWKNLALQQAADGTYRI